MSNEGQHQTDEKQVAEVISACNAAITLAPEDASAWYHKGNALIQAEDEKSNSSDRQEYDEIQVYRMEGLPTSPSEQHYGQPHIYLDLIEVVGNTIHGTQGRKKVPCTLKAAENVQIFKGEQDCGLSQLVAGDRLVILLKQSRLAQMVATAIWANLAAYSGRVKNLSDNKFVLILRKADSEQRYISVVTTEKTVVKTVKKKQIVKDGNLLDVTDNQRIQVLGEMKPDGFIEATQIFL